MSVKGENISLHFAKTIMGFAPTFLQNAIYFPERDFYLVSSHVHDFKTYEYLPGHWAMVDGGLDYIRRRDTPPEHAHLVVPFDLTTEDTYQTILDRLLWGSLPRHRVSSEPVFRPISSLAPDHLRAILETQKRADPLHLAVVRYWAAKKA